MQQFEKNIARSMPRIQCSVFYQYQSASNGQHSITYHPTKFFIKFAIENISSGATCTWETWEVFQSVSHTRQRHKVTKADLTTQSVLFERYFPPALSIGPLPPSGLILSFRLTNFRDACARGNGHSGDILLLQTLLLSFFFTKVVHRRGFTTFYWHCIWN